MKQNATKLEDDREAAQDAATVARIRADLERHGIDADQIEPGDIRALAINGYRSMGRAILKELDGKTVALVEIDRDGGGMTAGGRLTTNRIYGAELMLSPKGFCRRVYTQWYPPKGSRPWRRHSEGHCPLMSPARAIMMPGVWVKVGPGCAARQTETRNTPPQSVVEALWQEVAASGFV